MMPALLRYFSDLIHFKTSNPNPIPLHGNPILDNFVFKHAAVADDGFCRADIVPVAAHQNPVYAEFSAFLQRKRDHCRCITFAALTRADTVADMAACFQQIFIQIMSNIDSADKDISVFVKAKQRCVRNVSVRIPFLCFKVLKIIIKIVKIIAEYCIGGRICAVVFNIRFPFGQHFKQLFAVLRREPNKFNIHN